MFSTDLSLVPMHKLCCTRPQNGRSQTRMTKSMRTAIGAATALLTLGAVVTGCGSGDDSASSGSEAAAQSITVWSLENQTDRFTKTQEIAKAFTAKTGITVDLQAVDENQLPQLITQGAQADTLPDVIG